MNTLCEAFASEVLRIETFYREVEASTRPPLMSDDALVTLNRALGLTKGKDYRPYCLARGCTRGPRMALTATGFFCWSCHNNITFDLLHATQPTA